MQKFLQSPSLVPAGPLEVTPGDYEEIPQLRLADGVDPAQMRWPDLGYADAYLGSYATFAALRRQGVIPDGVRFQVQYPTPLASISAWIGERWAAGPSALAIRSRSSPSARAAAAAATAFATCGRPVS